MNLRFEPADDNRSGYVLAAMDMPVDPLKSVSLRRTSGGGFVPDVIEKEAERRSYARAAEIETSLYGSALKNGIPSSVVAEVIRVFSWDVDFQRDVRRGDRLEVLYDQMESPDGVKVKSGNIIFARLSIGGEDVAIYRYEKPDGDVDYYMQDGSSLRKTLMKTPVDGARISSGYGMRKHPVLGYNKMHKGMDFAAPTGTPIYAAGDGKIEYLGRNSSYGNYIRIRHNGNLKTAYAHMSRFARGLSNGSRVKQGQVIGYVGTTGRSTGPHLHYEVLVNNVQINPKSISVPQGDSLKGKELEAFHRHVNRISQQYSSLLGGQQFASYGGPAIRRQDLR